MEHAKEGFLLIRQNVAGMLSIGLEGFLEGLVSKERTVVMIRLLVVFQGRVIEEFVSTDGILSLIEGIETWGGQVIGLDSLGK